MNYTIGNMEGFPRIIEDPLGCPILPAIEDLLECYGLVLVV